MEIKDGVIIQGLKLPMHRVLKTADKIWINHNQELVITSGLDGTHSAGSLHPFGYAVDLRNRYFDQEEQWKVVNELQEELGDLFDVINETSHIHVEFDEALHRTYEYYGWE